MCTRFHCLQERAWSGWVSNGVMEAQSITKHINLTQHHQGHLQETGFINTEHPKSWGHSPVLLWKRYFDGTSVWDQTQSSLQCTQHTGAQDKFQDQVHWDASSFISETVAPYSPISTDITKHSVSGGLSCLKRQYIFFISRSQTWLTFLILVWFHNTNKDNCI
jgi:hypothetical protein